MSPQPGVPDATHSNHDGVRPLKLCDMDLKKPFSLNLESEVLFHMAGLQVWYLSKLHSVLLTEVFGVQQLLDLPLMVNLS